MRNVDSNQIFENANSPYKRRKIDKEFKMGSLNTGSDPR